MDTIFINSENSIISEHHVLVLKFTDKLDLRRGQKSVALSNVSIYYTWKNVKSSYNNNRFKISAPTWSEEFKLPDGSYSISDIQDYFKYNLKKHSENVALNHSSDIDFKDFMIIFKKYTAEPYSFLVNDTTLPSDNPLTFRKNVLK